MSTIPQGGSWSPKAELDSGFDNPLLIVHRNKAIVAIAFLAIASLAAGGALFYFRINTITAFSLVGAGGALAITDIAGAIVLKKLSKKEVTYRIISWNIATTSDFKGLLSLKKKVNDEKKDLLTSIDEIHNEPYQRITKEQDDHRIELFQSSFLQFENPDIICLQEVGEIKDLSMLLPEGYDHYSFIVNGEKECSVVWNMSKFAYVQDAKLFYDQTITSISTVAPDTIVVLKDLSNSQEVCIASSHLGGFNLNYAALNEQKKEEELRSAERGDNQLQYGLATMRKASHSDLYLFAGDFNATVEHYSSRFNPLIESGYKGDLTYSNPTIYDANLKNEDGTPKEVMLDYIFAKNGTHTKVKIEAIPLETVPLNNFDRPSDHLPVGAKVTLSYQI